MKRVGLFCAFVLLFISQSQSQFVLKGEFRPRFEFRDGYGKLLSKDQEPVFTVSNRTRLSAYYETGIFSFGFALQDVRIWGDDDIYNKTAITGSKASIDLNEGWLGIKPYKNGFIKIGRQYWNYEDGRLLSIRGWNQSEVKYDAVLIQHSQDKLKIDVGLSWNNLADKQFEDFYPDDKMKSLNFIYAKTSIAKGIDLSAMGVLSGFTASDTSLDINWQGTYGAYLKIKKAGLSALASGFYQSGRNRFAGEKTSAYLFAVSADYILKKEVSFGAGIDYLSGDNQKSSDPGYIEKCHAFDIFYGGRHSVLGHMDLFNDLPSSTKDGGLVDVYFRLKWMFVENAHVGGDFHLFSLQNEVMYFSGENLKYYEKGLGQELDLYASWDVSKIFNIKGGYSMFFATETMERIQGVYGNARFPNWAWIMITAKPIFLETAAK